MRIRKLDNEELIDLINHNPILHYFYGTVATPWFKCILEIDMPFKWSWIPDTRSPISYFFIDRNINQEIIILRTVYSQAITASTFIVDYRGWGGGFMSWNIRHLPWRQDYFPYGNSPVDIAKYQEYRKKMHSIETKYRQRIFVAMRKFAYSLEKVYPGDQLIDTVSGLEGLVIGGSEPEISHKFAERVCLMLESDPEKRLELLKEMKKAYSLRSSVAHGTAVIDNFDIFKLPEEKIKGIKDPKFKDSQKLRDIARKKLQEGIFLCLDRQSTDFKWDEIIMGKTIKP